LASSQTGGWQVTIDLDRVEGSVKDYRVIERRITDVPHPRWFEAAAQQLGTGQKRRFSDSARR
jgi:hypothetical protein